MNRLTITLVFLLLVCWSAQAGAAQDGTWTEVLLAEGAWTVSMPRAPALRKQKNSYDELKVEAEVYTVLDEGVEYSVWSLKNTNYARFKSLAADEYLDACADLVWESFFKPAREALPKQKGVYAAMSYRHEVPNEVLPGREYLIRLGSTQGVTRFHVDGERIYVLTVLNATADDVKTRRFFNSLSVPVPTGQLPLVKAPDLPAPAVVEVDPSLAPPAGPNRAYSPRDVTQKARLLSRPEPSYTDSARKYGVTGTVVLRGVISEEGQLTYIKVMKKLPHGLTKEAVEAARGIKFSPAIKDGQPVRQFIQIEYNFNLY